jgi:hypothetical protein
MRLVFTSRAEAKEKGRQAREDIRTRFSHEAISQQIIDRLSDIQTNLYGKDPAQVQREHQLHDSKPQTHQTQNSPPLQVDRRSGQRTRQKIHANMNNRV